MPARTNYKNGDEIQLTATGCDGCSPSVINGTFCHEAGCEYAWCDYQKKCYECGGDFYREDKDDILCYDCKHEAYWGCCDYMAEDEEEEEAE